MTVSSFFDNSSDIYTRQRRRPVSRHVFVSPLIVRILSSYDLCQIYLLYDKTDKFRTCDKVCDKQEKEITNFETGKMKKDLRCRFGHISRR